MAIRSPAAATADGPICPTARAAAERMRGLSSVNHKIAALVRLSSGLPSPKAATTTARYWSPSRACSLASCPGFSRTTNPPRTMAPAAADRISDDELSNIASTNAAPAGSSEPPTLPKAVAAETRTRRAGSLLSNTTSLATVSASAGPLRPSASTAQKRTSESASLSAAQRPADTAFPPPCILPSDSAAEARTIGNLSRSIGTILAARSPPPPRMPSESTAAARTCSLRSFRHARRMLLPVAVAGLIHPSILAACIRLTALFSASIAFTEPNGRFWNFACSRAASATRNSCRSRCRQVSSDCPGRVVGRLVGWVADWEVTPPAASREVAPAKTATAQREGMNTHRPG